MLEQLLEVNGSSYGIVSGTKPALACRRKPCKSQSRHPVSRIRFYVRIPGIQRATQTFHLNTQYLIVKCIMRV